MAFENDSDLETALDAITASGPVAAEPTPACKEFADRVGRRAAQRMAGGGGLLGDAVFSRPRPASDAPVISPALLWGLAKIIALIVSACADANINKGIERVNRRPHGPLARKFRNKVESGLVELGASAGEASSLAYSTVLEASSLRDQAGPVVSFAAYRAS